MAKRGEYALVFTMFILGLTLLIGWWLAVGIALLGLYLALLFLLPPLWWVALYLSQKFTSHSLIAQFIAAISVQLAGIWIVYLIIPSTTSPAAFLEKFTDWRVSTLLLLPFWLAFLLTWLFFKRVPAVSGQE
jgi:hypothetical protein